MVNLCGLSTLGYKTAECAQESIILYHTLATNNNTMSTTTSHIPVDHYYWHNGTNYMLDGTAWERYQETNEMPFIHANHFMNSTAHECNEEEFDEQYSDYLPHKICPELHRYYGEGLSEMIMDCDEFEDC